MYILHVLISYAIDIFSYIKGMRRDDKQLHLSAARGDDAGTDGFRQKPLPETLRNANQAEALLQRHAKKSQAVPELDDAEQAHGALRADKVSLWQQPCAQRVMLSLSVVHGLHGIINP